MDADENPYQAQFDQWDRYYRTVVLPQQPQTPSNSAEAAGSEQFTTCSVSTARTISRASLLCDVNVDVPLTTRNSYSEDFSVIADCDDIIDGLQRRGNFSCLRVPRHGSASSVTSSSACTSPRAASATTSSSESCISNRAHNKYALSPETSAYAAALVGLFDDTHDFSANVDDPENLRHTNLRDWSKSSLEDLRALPDPFAPKMRYLFE